MALSASSSSILEHIQNSFEKIIFSGLSRCHQVYLNTLKIHLRKLSFQGYLGVLHHLHLPLLTLCHRQDGPGGDTLSANFFTKLTISEPNWDDS